MPNTMSLRFSSKRRGKMTEHKSSFTSVVVMDNLYSMVLRINYDIIRKQVNLIYF